MVMLLQLYRQSSSQCCCTRSQKQNTRERAVELCCVSTMLVGSIPKFSIDCVSEGAVVLRINAGESSKKSVENTDTHTYHTAVVLLSVLLVLYTPISSGQAGWYSAGTKAIVLVILEAVHSRLYNYGMNITTLLTALSCTVLHNNFAKLPSLCISVGVSIDLRADLAYNNKRPVSVTTCTMIVI